jgi:ribonuclease HI
MVGGDFGIPRNWRTIFGNDSFSAEIEAIAAAFEEIKIYKKPSDKIIFSDCLSAISLANKHFNSNSELFKGKSITPKRIIENIKNNYNVEFVWIPSHVSPGKKISPEKQKQLKIIFDRFGERIFNNIIARNEMVDNLAKKATSKEKTDKPSSSLNIFASLHNQIQEGGL